MLVINDNGKVILNYNDCNIPQSARIKLKKKIGKIDILLSNYNHAGKILDYPLPTDEKLKEQIKENFFQTIESFNPKYTLPFASFHYYRASESIQQNTSLLEIDELLPLNNSIIPLKVGDCIMFDNNLSGFKLLQSTSTSLNKQSIKMRENKFSLENIQTSYSNFYYKINSGFFYLTFWVPPLIIRIIDLDIIVSMKLSKKSLTVLELSNNWHLSVHSSELVTWWSKAYGTDSFVVGGHFDLNKNKIFSLRIKILFGLLTENKLDFKSLLLMVFSIGGIRFLFNRREEILSLLFSNNFMFGIRK
jgi:hypothetical protein